MQNMLQYPVLTPSRPVSELSVQEAEVRLADCRENVHGMFDTFDSIFLDTVVRELGQVDCGRLRPTTRPQSRTR